MNFAAHVTNLKERIGDRPAVGDRRTATAAGGAQAQGRQTSRAQQGGPHRHRLRAKERHPLGDAPQGDGLRVRFDVLAEAARLAGGECVALVAPSLAGQAGEADEIDWSRASLDSASVAAKRGARRSERIRRIVANRARSAILFATGRVSRSP
jgi:hypothetical protein